MASFNQVTILGNAGKDPQITNLNNGNKIAKITVATQERGYTKKDGTKVEDRTEWHNVSFFGGLATVVEKYVKKGTQVFVQGKLRTSSYEKEGVKHYSTDIIAEDLQLCGSKNAENRPVDGRPNIENPTNGYSPKLQGAVDMINAKFNEQPAEESLPF